ncbi:tRNA dihydrouridine synthase DusB [Acidocella sp.]|uniref:tRNA dihydrouridine synthase DusB n=1 Tax=Acidocella sp. TaxID=50710 RepID=UPI00260E1A24|nr:tRNA dihydrouridine synthase DusB [Acidocella sp.]
MSISPTPSIKPIQIGTGPRAVTINEPVFLAPLSGVTDLPFRALVKEMGAGLVVSEMIASWAMVRENRQTLQMAEVVGSGGPNAVQLAGCEPAAMAEAAKIAVGMGADLIDINFGCPVKKVAIGQMAGSALMKDELRAGAILEATARAVDVPVTLKMRMGWDHNTLNAPKLARIAEEAGIALITVHGRTRQQFYEGTANWDFVREVKESVKLPVIVNGDITSEHKAAEALARSGADGVMIGRGSYGRPWFLRQVISHLTTGTPLAAPELAAQKEILLRHYRAVRSYFGEAPGVRLARKHIAWYSQGLRGSAAFRAQMNRMDDAAAVEALIDAFFDPLIAQGFVRQDDMALAA